MSDVASSPSPASAAPPAPQATSSSAIPAERAPNRVLDLAELERPDYRAVLERMDLLLARAPGAYLHPGKRWEYPWALERAGLIPGERVLDAGCGRSVFPLYLAALGVRATALDLDLDPRLGEPLDLPVGWVPGDLTAMPLPDGAFDAVFCISVIEHLPEACIPVAMSELRRVLRPGGRLLLTTDFYDDATAELWCEGPDRRFRVDWGVFDESRLSRFILEAPGFRVDGAVDLRVDWPAVKPRMRQYHGYPYTSVGVKLVRV